MFYYALKFPDLVAPMVLRFGQTHSQSWLISATKPMLTPQCSQRVLRVITFESLNQIFNIFKKSLHVKEHNIFHIQSEKQILC